METMTLLARNRRILRRPAMMAACTVFAGMLFCWTAMASAAAQAPAKTGAAVAKIVAMDGEVILQSLSLIHISEPTRPY